MTLSLPARILRALITLLAFVIATSLCAAVAGVICDLALSAAGDIYHPLGWAAALAVSLIVGSMLAHQAFTAMQSSAPRQWPALARTLVRA
jgi:hypothetical protein